MTLLAKIRIPAALALALLFPLHVASAAEAAKNTKADAQDEGPSDVEMPPLLAPMIVDNRLDSYAYITIQLTPASRDKVFLIREKVPFLQDGFLREVNKGPIGKANDPKAVDQEALKKRLLDRLNQILPKNTVSDLKFEQIVLSPIQAQ
jgi:flagellar basal body-associated protein FliL